MRGLCFEARINEGTFFTDKYLPLMYFGSNSNGNNTYSIFVISRSYIVDLVSNNSMLLNNFISKYFTLFQMNYRDKQIRSQFACFKIKYTEINRHPKQIFFNAY